MQKPIDNPDGYSVMRKCVWIC